MTFKKIKVNGRPKGTKKKRTFYETRFGCFLFYAAPMEYELIMASVGSGVFPFPDRKVVDIIMNASNSMVKDTRAYRLAYEAFVKDGQFPKREWKATPERIKYYTTLNRTREKYRFKNSKYKIKALRGLSGK